MATKTFSSRADEAALAYADALTRREFGMSFGQYCGSVLVDAIWQGVDLPKPMPQRTDDAKANALAAIKCIAQKPHDAEVGRLTDAQIKDLIASHYE